MFRHFTETSRTLRVLGAVGFTVLMGTALGLTLGTGRGQEGGLGTAAASNPEEWKIDPLRGPVDLGLAARALVGAIDVHVHLDPDAPGSGGVLRALDVFDAAIIAKARGMRGFVYKT